MSISFRLYKDGDIEKISNFLGKFSELNMEENSSRKVIWDCFSKHTCFEMFHPEKIGIWENEDRIVGVVRLESPWYGGVIIDVYPEYLELSSDMIRYAERTFSMDNRYLNVYVRWDDKIQNSLSQNGYSRIRENRMLSFDLASPISTVDIPNEFKLKSLKEIYSFEKLNDLLWRAFNYEGEPPAYGDDVYLTKKHAWLDYRQDICTIAEALDNNYASFCGMWFDEVTKSAFIEPLATLQRYRGKGLARACIYESMKKCKEIGAKIVFVESDVKPFEWYKEIGFKSEYKSYCWSKEIL